MIPSHQHSRINLTDLKGQIVKKLGLEGSKQYFYYLNRFLNVKLSKAEFNKLCLKILGRENIPLHNQLIRSILRNCCSAKAPPPATHNKNEVLKQHKSGKEISADGYYANGFHTGITQASGLQNGGGILPISPRKVRSNLHDQKSGDRRRILEPNGNTSLPTARQSNDFNAVLENKNPNPPQNRKDQREAVVRNDGNEFPSRCILQAPLGVPFCPGSVGGSDRALSCEGNSRFSCISNDDALLDSFTLRERMEQIAVSQGLEGVSMECANLLNNGLDVYLKGLIRSCIQLVGTRPGHELTQNNNDKHQTSLKLINGVRHGQIQTSGTRLEAEEQRFSRPISLQDFIVAMESNPQQLGEDWPLLLEKISIHSFGE